MKLRQWQLLSDDGTHTVDSCRAELECVEVAFEGELWRFNGMLLLLPIVLQC